MSIYLKTVFLERALFDCKHICFKTNFAKIHILPPVVSLSLLPQGHMRALSHLEGVVSWEQQAVVLPFSTATEWRQVPPALHLNHGIPHRLPVAIKNLPFNTWQRTQRALSRCEKQHHTNTQHTQRVCTTTKGVTL